MTPMAAREMREAQAAFKAHLQARGLRPTPGRMAVLEEAGRRKGHFDLEELVAALRQRHVSRASVYRTLPLLVEAGVIEQVENTGKHAHYEMMAGKGHHDHMLCTLCGRVVEFYSGELERLQERLCQSEGFAGQSHTLEIRGQCRKCARTHAHSSSARARAL